MQKEGTLLPILRFTDQVCKWLQIEIDDRLPVSHSGELLCSHSSNRDEFWVSLIEKAYMKVGSHVDTASLLHCNDSVCIVINIIQ